MAEEMREHTLTLKNREKLTMSGVAQIISFDETLVVLETALGILHVQGDGLQLKTLSVDGGQVEVVGTITALTYEAIRTGGWLHRFFA